MICLDNNFVFMYPKIAFCPTEKVGVVQFLTLDSYNG